MKNKKKILSLIACLSLLSSCNKSVPSISSCSVTTSTAKPTPSKTVEELNKELFENYAIIEKDVDTSSKGNYLNGFKENIPEEYLKLETLIIPENIHGEIIENISNTIRNGMFQQFSNLKNIIIPSTIKAIFSNSISSTLSSPFMNLPNLENIKVENNDNFYVSGNCLIRKGEQEDRSDDEIICGWGEVILPEFVSKLDNYVFAENSSITKITLNTKLNEINKYTFRRLEKLANIDTGDNTMYFVKDNALYSETTVNPTFYTAWSNAKITGVFSSITFNYCYSLTSVDLSQCSELKSFSSEGFQYTAIEELTIPSTVTRLEKNNFKYMDKLKKITIEDTDSVFKVEPGTNCLYDSSKLNITNNTPIIAGWGDVKVPSPIKKLLNSDFLGNASITSITLHKEVDTISGQPNSPSNSSDPFRGINRNRELEDYFKLYVEEGNPTFKMKDNCLVTNYDSDDETALLVFPDTNGAISFPDSVRIVNLFNSNFTEICNSSDIKSLNFNDNIKELNPRNNFTSYNFNFENITLPYSLEKLTSTSNTFFKGLGNIKSMSFSNNRTENETFKIESNCIVKKKAHIDGGDRFIFGYRDIIMPESVTSLGLNEDPYSTNIFANLKSLTSITFKHTNFNYVDSETFKELSTSSCTDINYYGTLEEFKTKEYKDGTSSNVMTTMYKAISNNKENNQTIRINFYNSDGTKDKSYLMSEIDNIDVSTIE